MTSLPAYLFGLATALYERLGKFKAHHELADPAEIFDVMDRPPVTATPSQALLAGLAILLIPLVIVAFVFWSRRSKES